MHHENKRMIMLCTYVFWCEQAVFQGRIAQGIFLKFYITYAVNLLKVKNFRILLKVSLLHLPSLCHVLVWKKVRDERVGHHFYFGKMLHVLMFTFLQRWSYIARPEGRNGIWGDISLLLLSHYLEWSRNALPQAALRDDPNNSCVTN